VPRKQQPFQRISLSTLCHFTVFISSSLDICNNLQHGQKILNSPSSSGPEKHTYKCVFTTVKTTTHKQYQAYMQTAPSHDINSH